LELKIQYTFYLELLRFEMNRLMCQPEHFYLFEQLAERKLPGEK